VNNTIFCVGVCGGIVCYAVGTFDVDNTAANAASAPQPKQILLYSE